ncbi:sodium:solute symporter family protein [Aureliella helgolandensis]|uniref:Sodium/glucose cotransporter n=1 Tax=Aureliella helgolandensis TaxID=2527968 RepID=A0A518G2V1_9BACT|nr:sodium:solute symporter family protein [Aureliella helgolandensis]QDV22937.1 Sodium/glucose cotransporter [Aureliella helgolandensis]
MNVFGIHLVDLLVLAAYFAVILYLGVYLGAKKTKTLGDFFVAGGRWGPLVSFVFVFASAIAGNEAVVVSGQSYSSGLSGVWYWWSFLFATPVYFLFSTYYRRARVYNLAEFLEMRYSRAVAAMYAVIAGIVCVLFIGMFVLAIGKILAGFTDFPLPICVWTISVIVAAYVFSGGMMSALLTDLVQGVMCLVILGFVMLPFVGHAAGGMKTLRSLPAETWDFIGEGMTLTTVVALNVSALVGGIAAPWIYSWIAVSRDERAATQCAWGHLWKRIVTLLFAVYGIFFATLAPEMSDPELAWGVVMKEVLPIGVGVVGLMIASFFAAAMSSADTYATTSSAMTVDFLYRKVIAPHKTTSHYLMSARCWAVVSIFIAAASTSWFDHIKDYVKLCMAILSFLGIPIYFGVIWRRANTTGMWASILLGITSHQVITHLLTGDGRLFSDADAAFATSVFVPTLMSLTGMWIGSLLGPAQSSRQLDRFYAIMNTPIGSEQRLVDAGIKLPSLVDAGLVDATVEELNAERLSAITQSDAEQKYFGPQSNIELRREQNATWYVRGFVLVTLSCVGLVVGTWFVTRLLFVW